MAYFTFQMLHLKVLCYLLNLLPESVHLTLSWNDAAFWEMSAPLFIFYTLFFTCTLARSSIPAVQGTMTIAAMHP